MKQIVFFMLGCFISTGNVLAESKIDKELKKMPVELANMSFDQQVSDQTFAAIGAWDFRAEVGRLQLPVLLLWGRDDPFGLAMAEATMSAFSGEIDFVVLDGCGHYWHECPEAFFAQVLSFLEQVSIP